jgi:hypothetical protein
MMLSTERVTTSGQKIKSKKLPAPDFYTEQRPASAARVNASLMAGAF